MLARMFSPKLSVWYKNKENIMTKHLMSDFPIFMEVTLAEQYLSTKDKYNILYVGSSYILTE